MEHKHEDASDVIADVAQTLMRRQQSRHLLLTQPSILASRTRASLWGTPAQPSSTDAASNTLHGTNSRHSLDQTRLSEVLGSSTSTFKAALPAQGRVQRWAKTRCLVSSDCVRATATGFNREPLPSVVSDTPMREGCFELVIRVESLEGGARLGVVKLGADNHEKSGMTPQPESDGMQDDRWQSSPCASWSQPSFVNFAYFLSSAGLVMSGNTHVLPPGWAVRADHGIRWGDLVSCPLSFAQVLCVACLSHSLKDSQVSNRARASA